MSYASYLSPNRSLLGAAGPGYGDDYDAYKFQQEKAYQQPPVRSTGAYDPRNLLRQGYGYTDPRKRMMVPWGGMFNNMYGYMPYMGDSLVNRKIRPGYGYQPPTMFPMGF